MKSKLYKLAIWYIAKCNAEWNKRKFADDLKSLDRLTYWNFGKYMLVYGADAEWAKEHIGEVVRRNVPFMQDWFGRIKTIDDIIAQETKSINECNTEISFPYCAYWVRGFLYAKQHRMDEAIADIQRIYERYGADKQIPQNVLKKLYEVDKLI